MRHANKLASDTTIFAATLFFSYLDTLDTSLDLLLVADISTLEGRNSVFLRDWFEILVQNIEQWHTSRDVKLRDDIFGDVVEVFHQCSQGIAMCCDQDALASFDLRSDLALEIRDNTSQSSLIAE